MKPIDANSVFKQNLVKQLGLNEYKQIMDRLYQTDVSTDQEFQRVYDHYYRVRKNISWRENYFKIFQSFKNVNNIATFENIIYEINKLTGTVEASFASKMLATLHPDKPLWDSKVMNFFEININVQGKKTKERLKEAVKTYSKLEQYYSDYLKTEEAKQNIQIFNSTLPEYAQISDVKKIDCLIWGQG